jgi:hypothetical protein
MCLCCNWYYSCVRYPINGQAAWIIWIFVWHQCPGKAPLLEGPRPQNLQITVCISGLVMFWVLAKVLQWLWRCATSRNVSGSTPDEVNEFFSIFLILPAALGPRVYSASNTNEYHKPGIALLYGDGVCFLWGTNWTVSTATNSQYLAVNCEPIV